MCNLQGRSALHLFGGDHFKDRCSLLDSCFMPSIDPTCEVSVILKVWVESERYGNSRGFGNVLGADEACQGGSIDCTLLLVHSVM